MPDGAIRPHDEGRQWRCLITNDDGIHSEGLRVLAQVALEAGFEVVVAAPMRESSGASASITAIEEDGHFVVEPRPLAGLEDACTVLAVGGLPAFIALTSMRGAFPARLARFGAVQTNVAEQGEGYVKVTLAEIDAEYEPGTDAAFVAAGYAAITALRAVCEAGTTVRVPELAARSTGGR